MAYVVKKDTHRNKEWLAIDDTGWLVFNFLF